MALQKHIVKNFLVQLGTSGYSNSYALQRRCTTTVKEKVIAGMETVLTDNFPAEQTIRINRIEIDLGNVEEAKLEEAFSEKLLQAFSAEIKKIASNKTVSNVKTGDEADENIILIEQFFYFLNKGVLTWSLFNTAFDTWQYNLLQAIEKQPQCFAEKLGRVLQNNPVAATRLLHQFNSSFIITAVEAALPVLKNKFVPVVQSIKDNAPAAAHQKMMLLFLQKVLSATFNVSFKKEPDAVDKDAAYDTGKVADKKTNQQKINTALEEFFNHLQKYTGKNADEFTAATPVAQQETIPDDIAITDKQTEKSAETIIEKDESIFIQNSGLILLHPFLNNFFTATSLMKGEKFNDADASNKAVHLLQHLVNTQTETPEYFLILNKILCGIPQQEHINRFVQLTEQECTEAMQLLQAVIQHWEILKNSSPQALQETFLQRTGKLFFSKDENCWVLHVEKKGVDILLEKIPWGYSYIKHPWMQHAVRVNWI